MNLHFISKKNHFLLLSAAIVFATSCGSEKSEETSVNKDTPIAVTLATPVGNDQQDLSISGQVEASQTANISTRIMGYITQLKVKVGDRVTKGQVIATISNQDILAKKAQTEAMISEAQAAVTSAQKDYDRFTILYKQQSATAKELDNATLQWQSAQSRLEAAKQMRSEVVANLGYTTLTAPFAGIITQKWADAGSIANPGMPIVALEQTGTFQISASVPENNIQQLQLNHSVTVHIKALEKTFKGTISQINPSSQYTGGQYIVKISIPEDAKKGLYAGMYANVTIDIKKTDTTSMAAGRVLVSSASIEHKEQLTGLYTVSSNNTALLRWVRLGKTYGDQVEVLSGLERTESYIMAAEGKLYNGAPVKTK